MSSTYRVSLDSFEGPLDLLLRLIEKREMDITQVSLALVTDQYLVHIANLGARSAHDLAEFLAIAARLLVIKSRYLLPRPQDEPATEEADDPGEALAERLRQYRSYKLAAEELRRAEEAGQRSYPRSAPPPLPQRRFVPGEISLRELQEAFKAAMQSEPERPVDQVVPPVTVHLADCMAKMEEALRTGERIRFSTLLLRTRSRLEAIVMVLALLELIKQQRVCAIQEEPFGEIHLERRELDPSARLAPPDLNQYGEGA